MMRPVTKDNVLKSLKAIYWQARKNNNWDIALRAVEQKAKYTSMLDKQRPPSQRLPEAMRIEDMTEAQLKDFVAALEKLYPELKDLGPNLKNLVAPGLEHPPPPAPV